MFQNPGIFESLLSQPGHPTFVENMYMLDHNHDIIGHDVFKESSGPGRLALFKVLKAYSIYNTVDGYQQSFYPIAVMLVGALEFGHNL